MKTPILKNLLVAVLISGIALSCSKKEDFSGQDDEQIEDVQIGLTFRKASLRNQPVEFKIFDDEGTEITENLSFFVDGNLLAGNSFQSDVNGSFEVYAEYDFNGTLITTEVEEFQVITPIQKLVIEDYTGTWCGYCPAVSAAVDEIYSETPHLSVVAIHNGDNLTLPVEPQIREGLGVFSGSPRAMVNRINPWGSGTNFPAEEVLSQIGSNANSAISIQSTIDANNLFVKVSVASEEEMQGKKLVVYLTEDYIPRDQENYFNNDETSPYFGLGNPIADFEQNHVLRTSLTNILGDEIPATAALVDYETSFSYNIPSDFVKENLHLVVMLVNADNEAINSQNAPVDSTVSYQ